jgi:hypothetical protein
MPNKELADWQKIVIMATAPFRGNRSVADKAECSVWAVRKYRNRMKEQEGPLDIDVDNEVDEHEYGEFPFVNGEGMEMLDTIVEEGLEQERGRI